MAHTRNDNIRNTLRARAAELEPLLTVGDRTVAHTLAAEFATYFREQGISNPYQMVCYYLRDASSDLDRRKSYSTAVLSHLALMPPEQRAMFARSTGRSVRAINSAVDRFVKESERKARVPKSKTSALLRIESNGFIDLSSEPELSAKGLSRGMVLATRKALISPWGLALRAPNILYHQGTKKRYFMVEAEQLQMLDNPVKYLRRRSAHIRDNWVVGNFDPISDATIDDTPPLAKMYKRMDYGTTASGGVDFTSKQLRKPKMLKHIEALQATISKTENPVEGSVVYKALHDLYVEIGQVLASPDKPFEGSDPDTWAPDKKVNLISTPEIQTATHWVEGPDGDMVEVAGEPAIEVDDDSWMESFKPSSEED